MTEIGLTEFGLDLETAQAIKNKVIKRVWKGPTSDVYALQLAYHRQKEEEQAA